MLCVRLIIIVLCFIALDIITGFIGAIKNRVYKSEIMREGLYHKCGELISIGFAFMCEYCFPLIGVNINIPIAAPIIIYIIVMETGSIIENLSKISPEIKSIMEKTFKSYTKEYEDNEDKHLKG